MGWWSKDEIEAAKKPERNFEKDYADARAEIAALVAEAEIGARVKSVEILAAAKADLEIDRAGYRFECRRWGDFLSLFMERMAYEYRDGGCVLERVTYATSVNIRETRAIRLIDGHEPDENGVLRYSWQTRRDDDKSGSVSWSSGGTGHPTRPAQDGCHYEVWPHYPTHRLSGRTFALDKKSGSDNYAYSNGCSGDALPNRTENFVRPAEDDRIRFDGVGATIFAPVGCGLDAHDAILREIAEKS